MFQINSHFLRFAQKGHFLSVIFFWQTNRPTNPLIEAHCRRLKKSVKGTPTCSFWFWFNSNITGLKKISGSVRIVLFILTLSKMQALGWESLKLKHEFIHSYKILRYRFNSFFIHIRTQHINSIVLLIHLKITNSCKRWVLQ